MTLPEALTTLDALPNTETMPTIFLGHGSPMNAILDTPYSRAWRALGENLPRPTAILTVFAHWLTDGGTLVHTSDKPKTIHDFWGFPKELYDISHSAPGSPQYASAVVQTVTSTHVEPDTEWGLDHGAWSVLKHLYPHADIPVFQLSIDFSKHGDFHLALGRELARLREKGVLILGSGNIVHNLGRMQFDSDAAPHDWAIEFDTKATQLIDGRDFDSIASYEKLGSAAAHSIPTPDHFWPLLYVLGASNSQDAISYPVTGIAHSSVSMRAVLCTPEL